MKNAFQRIAIYLGLTFAALTFIYPFLWMASASLKPENEIGNLALLSRNFSFRAYYYVFHQIPIARAFFNSLFVSTSITLSVLVFSSMVGYALARLKFIGRDFVLGLVLMTMMVPGQLTLIPLYVLVVRFGWLNSYQALIAPGMISTTAILIFRQFFLGLPQELVDAARMDGCSDRRILFRLFWPLAKPALITVGIITFIGTWNDVLWPLMTIREWKKMTMPQMVTLFQVGGLANAQVAATMAAAMLLALPVILAYLFFQRYFIESVALSGIRG